MTRAVEVFYLPLLLLTVTLLGGLRVADRIIFVAPPLVTLVLAALLLVALVRCGALAPDRLMNAGRPPLANVTGAIVLLTTFAGSVQAFNCVIPETGVPHLGVTVIAFLLLLNTLVAARDRTHLLRSAAVILGSTFVLKFIVLAALADPDGGWLKRVLTAMLEGVTLGTFGQQPFASATGYVAFLTLALFLLALALLPRDHRLLRR